MSCIPATRSHSRDPRCETSRPVHKPVKTIDSFAVVSPRCIRLHRSAPPNAYSRPWHCTPVWYAPRPAQFKYALNSARSYTLMTTGEETVMLRDGASQTGSTCQQHFIDQNISRDTQPFQQILSQELSVPWDKNMMQIAADRLPEKRQMCTMSDPAIIRK